MAYCKNCKKLAFFNQPHKCINCPRFCNNKEDRFCSYCATIKKICQVCGKQLEDVVIDNSGDKIHPFFGERCKTCSSKWNK
jgi:hypothetical protein